jgi:hypothetical protein
VHVSTLSTPLTHTHAQSRPPVATFSSADEEIFAPPMGNAASPSPCTSPFPTLIFSAIPDRALPLFTSSLPTLHPSGSPTGLAIATQGTACVRGLNHAHHSGVLSLTPALLPFATLTPIPATSSIHRLDRCAQVVDEEREKDCCRGTAEILGTDGGGFCGWG